MRSELLLRSHLSHTRLALFLRTTQRVRSPLAHHFSRTHRFLSSQPRFTLRPYQEDCITKCIDTLNNNKRRIAVSLPTGGGKTVVFSNLIDRVLPRNGQGDKCMILVHRKELALQAAETCMRVHPDKSVQIEMGDHKADPDTADIVIASVQTLMRDRLVKFDPRDFKMLIIDEAHHAAANSYLEIVDYFGITSTSDIPVVGFSATLRREDEKSLDTVFDEIVFHLDLEEMILNNHLSDAKFTTIRLKGADLEEVSSRRGDFVIRSLSKVMNTDANNELVFHTYQHFAEAHKVKSTLLFGVDIAHVETLCALFRANGIAAEFVTSKTKKASRTHIVDGFKSGKFPVLMNCGIFTEGTDIPNIDCIMLVRPTQSKTLLIQMIGRGLRLHESKEFCHVVDFVGVNGSNVVSTPTLRNLPSSMVLDGLSLEDMEALAEKQAEREKEKLRQLEDNKRKKEEELKAQYHKDEKSLNSSAMDPEPKLDLDAFEEIELTTFNTFSDFLVNLGDVPAEAARFSSIQAYYISKSIYPWIRGPTSNVWVLPWPDRSSNSHLRLEIHPNGPRKDFFDDIHWSDVYVYKDPAGSVRSRVYSLTMYRERRGFSSRSSSMFDRYQKRYNAALVMPLSQDIRLILSHVRKLFEGHFRHRDHSKFAKWRKDPASPNQISAAWSGVKKIMKGTPQEDQDIVKEKITRMTKGQAADLLTAQNIFRTVPSKKFVSKCLKDTTDSAKTKDSSPVSTPT